MNEVERLSSQLKTLKEVIDLQETMYKQLKEKVDYLMNCQEERSK